MSEIDKLVKFLEYTEGLKTGLRHTWLSDGRQESAAEHTWRMALIAMILAPKTKLKLDLDKVIKMVLIHDIVEIDAPDIPTFKHMNSSELTNKKKLDEAASIIKVRSLLDDESGKDIMALWQEYAERKTNESKFAAYLDKIEARSQKYLQPRDKWVPEEQDISFVHKYTALIDELANGDEFLLDFALAVRKEREKRTGILGNIS